MILPALAEIGRRWETTEISVGHEHFASHLIERRLLRSRRAGRRAAARSRCSRARRASATRSGSCVGLVLADRGWRIAYLGADTPVDQILDMSASVSPTAVMLCARDARHVANSADAIAMLAERHPTLLAGGGANAELAARLGAALAQGDPVAAAEQLAASPPRAVSDDM